MLGTRTDIGLKLKSISSFLFSILNVTAKTPSSGEPAVIISPTMGTFVNKVFKV